MICRRQFCSIIRPFLMVLISTALTLSCSSNTNAPPPKVKETKKDSIVSTPPPPPKKAPPPPDFDTTQWAEPQRLDSTIQLDLRYATTNNFVEEQLYPCPRCFLRPSVAEALLQVHQQLLQQGYGGLLLFDCYRPKSVQERLWEKVPNASYVTPPKKGSMHNKGAAVDLTILDANGSALDMGTEFDFFGPAAHHTYQQLSDSILTNRKLLKTLMEKVGFRSIRTEWWHYSYRSKTYPISDMRWNCPTTGKAESEM